MTNLLIVFTPGWSFKLIGVIVLMLIIINFLKGTNENK